MSFISNVPKPNLWKEICNEFESYNYPKGDDEVSLRTEMSDFDARKHHPVLYGKLHAPISTDFDIFSDFNPAISHPACAGLALLDKPLFHEITDNNPSPDIKTCPPREFLEYYIFPSLLPSLAAMLNQATNEKCFQRKRTKFNSLDFITEHLYKNNPNFSDRKAVDIWEIPFVKDWLKYQHGDWLLPLSFSANIIHRRLEDAEGTQVDFSPRPPLPMSLLWTEEEATLIIQSHWRGYMVRREPEVQELRQWQREWREMNCDIQQRVSDFWDSKMKGHSEAANEKHARNPTD